MAFTPSQIADLAAGVTEDLDRGEWVQTAQAYQDYPIVRMLMQEGRFRVKGGKSFKFNVMNRTQGGSGYVQLYEEDNVDRGKHITAGEVQWRHLNRSWGIDIRELDMASPAEEIVDLIKVQDDGLYIDAAEDIETGAWQVPSSTDVLLPHGIPYSVIWSSTTAAGGFDGSLANGHTAKYGLTPSSEPNQANWAFTYTSITEDDFYSLASTAFRKVRFRPPPKVEGVNTMNYACFTDETTTKALEALARQRNDNIGFDLDATKDEVTFKRVPITWVPYLDTAPAASSNPFYGINLTHFYVGILRNNNMRETGPRPAPKQHNVVEKHLDHSWNFANELFRAHFVGAKAAPFGES
jgi:hypothetical protein